jgi:excisionase family DNA binding protein
MNIATEHDRNRRLCESSAFSGSVARSEWLTSSEAAAYLKVKVRSLLLWVRQGKVPAFALSGTRRRVWRFRKEDLDNALLSRPVVTSKTPAVLAHERRL